jgi:hypothetical protein
MGNPKIEDGDKYKVVVSQEESRLRYLHPTPEEIPSCMSAFDDFLSCNSMPTALSSSVFSRRFDAVKISSRYPAQVHIPLWRDGTLLS